MAQFEGTTQEFHHFLGPRLRNSINNFTRKYRNQKNGICENCGKEKELHSAHVHGQERRTIIEKVLSSYVDTEIVRCDIEVVEKQILEAHLPIETCFKFLCHTCHVAYDSDNNQSFRKNPILKDSSGEKHSKLSRIKLWAERSHQDNHKIIMAYLNLEKKGDVKLRDLKNLCSNKSNSHYFVEKFDGHYASMKTDKGNSHGKVFYDQKGIVYIWPIVRDEIKSHFKNG